MSGGFAFPRPAVLAPGMFGDSYTVYDHAQDGMSKREFYAAAALQGWLSNWPEGHGPGKWGNFDTDAVARLMFKFADSMMREGMPR